MLEASAATLPEEDPERIDADKCMGCGVYTIVCDQEALRLKRGERESPLPSARELARTIAAENRGMP